MMGLELRKARERAGITQEEPSFRAGLSRPYISQLERDLKSPTLDTLFRICDAPGVSADTLVKRADARRSRRPGVWIPGRDWPLKVEPHDPRPRCSSKYRPVEQAR